VPRARALRCFVQWPVIGAITRLLPVGYAITELIVEVIDDQQ
jgi:hypothetical protein